MLTIILVGVAALLALLDLLGVTARFNMTALAVLLVCLALVLGKVL